jgi:hypothetical protein
MLNDLVEAERQQAGGPPDPGCYQPLMTHDVRTIHIMTLCSQRVAYQPIESIDLVDFFRHFSMPALTSVVLVCKGAEPPTVCGDASWRAELDAGLAAALKRTGADQAIRVDVRRRTER